MNIPSPLLPAARREPASRPIAETTAAARDPAGFASLLRQSQAAPRPMQTVPSPRREESASSHADVVAAAPAAAPAPPPSAAHAQGPDADPMDPPNFADGTPAPAPQGRPRPAAPGKPPPAGPTGIGQREAKVITDATAEGGTTGAGKAGLESLPPLPPEPLLFPPLPPLPPLPLPPLPLATDALPGTASTSCPPQPLLPPLPLATDAGPGPASASRPATLQPAQRGTTAADAGGQPATADRAANVIAGGMPDTADDPSATRPQPEVGATKRSADKAGANEARLSLAAEPELEPDAAVIENGGRFAPALTEPAVDKTPPQAAAARSADAAIAIAIGASFIANPDTRSQTAPAVAVALATPVTTPEFAQELGLRMSVLAQDGVQHAELQLNPADMGPVSVQIVIDGNRARVDFGADLAATRAAIEAGLPALASALNDAGFTLTGGGVSQHSRGRENGNGGSQGGSAAPRERRIEGQANDAATRAASAASRRIVTLGGLDLYA